MTLTAAQLGDAGNYQVIATNACAAQTSIVATFTVVLPPQLGGTLRLNGHGFEFSLLGQAGRQYAIEKSTNLLTWDVLASVTPTNSLWLFLDPSATNTASAFYRARLMLP